MSDELRPVVTYPRDAVLEPAHVCAALAIARVTLDKMDLPCFYAGNRPRYLWGQVLDVLAERAMPSPAEPATQRNRRRAG